MKSRTASIIKGWKSRDELIAAKQNNEKLEARNQELKNENLKYENMSGNINNETKALSDELERVRIIAGLEDVKGMGLVITIDKDESAFVDDSDILKRFK